MNSAARMEKKVKMAKRKQIGEILKDSTDEEIAEILKWYPAFTLGGVPIFIDNIEATDVDEDGYETEWKIRGGNYDYKVGFEFTIEN